MVGVPGRSKGCKTCRGRKKGCDKNRPSCSQCLRAGLLCGGYGRETVWVSATEQHSTIKAIYTKPKASSSSPRDTPSPYAVAERGDITLHSSLVQSAREKKYLGLYWSEYLFRGRSFSPEACRLSTSGWTGHLHGLYETEPALRYAILALSMSMLAGSHRDEQLRVKGLQTYTAAVGEMGKALKTPGRARADGLLAAVRLMAFYEILYGKDSGLCDGAPNSSQVSSWTTHNQGEVALFMQRGPTDLTEGPGHQIYIDGRLSSLVSSLAARKRSPLSLPEWKNAPFNGRPKNAVDRLMDILVDVPGFMEDLDTLRTCQGLMDTDLLWTDLLTRCQLAIHDMEVWRAEVGDRLDRFDYTVVGIPVPVPTQDVDLALLQLSNLYWMGCILLGSTHDYIISSGTDEATTPVGSSPSSARPPIMDPLLNAYKIARAVHLFFQPNFGAYAISMAIFPLGVALRYLLMAEPPLPGVAISEERKLLVAMFNKPFLGTSVGSFLKNLQSEGTSREVQEMEGAEGRWARAREWWGRGNAHRGVESAMG